MQLHTMLTAGFAAFATLASGWPTITPASNTPPDSSALLSSGPTWDACDTTCVQRLLYKTTYSAAANGVQQAFKASNSSQWCFKDNNHTCPAIISSRVSSIAARSVNQTMLTLPTDGKCDNVCMLTALSDGATEAAVAGMVWAKNFTSIGTDGMLPAYVNQTYADQASQKIDWTIWQLTQNHTTTVNATALKEVMTRPDADRPHYNQSIVLNSTSSTSTIATSPSTTCTSLYATATSSHDKNDNLAIGLPFLASPLLLAPFIYRGGVLQGCADIVECAAKPFRQISRLLESTPDALPPGNFLDYLQHDLNTQIEQVREWTPPSSPGSPGSPPLSPDPPITPPGPDPPFPWMENAADYFGDWEYLVGEPFWSPEPMTINPVTGNPIPRPGSSTSSGPPGGPGTPGSPWESGSGVETPVDSFAEWSTSSLNGAIEAASQIPPPGFDPSQVARDLLNIGEQFPLSGGPNGGPLEFLRDIFDGVSMVPQLMRYEPDLRKFMNPNDVKQGLLPFVPEPEIGKTDPDFIVEDFANLRPVDGDFRDIAIDPQCPGIEDLPGNLKALYNNGKIMTDAMGTPLVRGVSPLGKTLFYKLVPIKTQDGIVAFDIHQVGDGKRTLGKGTVSLDAVGNLVGACGPQPSDLNNPPMSDAENLHTSTPGPSTTHMKSTPASSSAFRTTSSVKATTRTSSRQKTSSAPKTSSHMTSTSSTSKKSSTSKTSSRATSTTTVSKVSSTLRTMLRPTRPATLTTSIDKSVPPSTTSSAAAATGTSEAKQDGNLKMCPEANYGGTCENIELTSGQCMTFPGSLDSYVRSAEVDNGYLCILYDTSDCSKAEAEVGYFTSSTSNLDFRYPGPYSSIKCERPSFPCQFASAGGDATGDFGVWGAYADWDQARFDGGEGLRRELETCGTVDKWVFSPSKPWAYPDPGSLDLINKTLDWEAFGHMGSGTNDCIKEAMKRAGAPGNPECTNHDALFVKSSAMPTPQPTATPQPAPTPQPTPTPPPSTGSNGQVKLCAGPDYSSVCEDIASSGECKKLPDSLRNTVQSAKVAEGYACKLSRDNQCSTSEARLTTYAEYNNLQTMGIYGPFTHVECSKFPQDAPQPPAKRANYPCQFVTPDAHGMFNLMGSWANWDLAKFDNSQGLRRELEPCGAVDQWQFYPSHPWRQTPTALLESLGLKKEDLDWEVFGHIMSGTQTCVQDAMKRAGAPLDPVCEPITNSIGPDQPPEHLVLANYWNRNATCEGSWCGPPATDAQMDQWCKEDPAGYCPS